MSFGQGGPHGPGGPDRSTTPDWGALADNTAARNRRRKLMFIGGGAVATAAVAALVATAVVNANNRDSNPQSLPTPETLPSDDPAQPEPSFSDVSPPPPPDPRDFISDVERDTAPLSAGNLFPADRMTINERSYGKGATSSTKTCAAAASGRLAPALSGNDCTQVIRATYSKDGVAVTVGVAVFDTEAQATKAKEQASGNIQSLPGKGVPGFCRATACRLTANSIGRYTYFTVAGYTSGKAVTTADTKARQAGKDVSDYTFRRIVGRGEAQASAAATEQTG